VKALFGCLLFVIVLAMAMTDARKMILPNKLNLLLAVVGIAQSCLIGRPGFVDAVLGACVAIVILGSIAAVFRNLRGTEGLGFGDLKFAAASGLWIGWQEIAPMLLIASASAIAFVIFRSVRAQRFERTLRVPFGPFLGIGTFIIWLTTVAVG
jgi:leader peptidase (prepilin peptidase)/N-methyltransferase